MSKVVLVPELDEDQMQNGYIWVTKVDEKGPRRGMMLVSDVADVLQEFFNWDAAGREVRMISRFEKSPFLALGQNGAKWVAVKTVDPGEYFLTTVTGSAFKVQFPRLVVKVSNYDTPYFYWTADEQPAPESKLFPLVIGNISDSGWVCMGTTGLKCKAPEDIDNFVRQVIEAPTTGAYLHGRGTVEDFYQALSERWDPSIGDKYGIPLKRLLAVSA